MTAVSAALRAMWPTLNFADTDGTLANVRYDEPLPEGFTPPTQAEIDAAVARLDIPADITRDQAMQELASLGKLDAAFSAAQQAGGLTYQRWFNFRWQRTDFDEPPLSQMATVLGINVDDFFRSAGKR